MQQLMKVGCHHSSQLLKIQEPQEFGHKSVASLKYHLYLLFSKIRTNVMIGSQSMRKEHRLRAFKNRTLSTIFGPKRDDVKED